MKRLLEKYKDVVEIIARESGLIDNCKYMIYFTDAYSDSVHGSSYPVQTLKEAEMIIKDVKADVETEK